MMNHFQLSNEALSIEQVQRLLNDDATGGQVLFVGTVRNVSKGKRVVRLEFEAYEPMVMRELEKIAVEIKSKWLVHKIVLHHRLGMVSVGEVPVIAAISSTHRAPAFEACAHLMNRLKESVPIWKKEVMEDGEVWVTETP
ncbi:MAG: molybdenum cofactor biosynthesis protein MoaE [Flavobacteriales bacterium]|nr:molybdenum cofactor biosynthesis protein MoaE [Flavobacteriales bacterium]